VLRTRRQLICECQSDAGNCIYRNGSNAAFWSCGLRQDVSDRSQLNCKKQDGFQTHFGLFKDGFSHLMKASDHYIQKIFVFYD
jgi:hypothetical protein